jgi:DeoR family glycerol-3-phosphate regulon repressor
MGFVMSETVAGQSAGQTAGRRRSGYDFRRHVLLKHLDDHGAIEVVGLAEKLDVSSMTIRRDLDDLAAEGLVRRIHGGAVAAVRDGTLSVDVDEPDFDLRLRRDHGAKEAIADTALGLIGDARSIAIDVGTSTYLLARRLADHRNLRVFTNSLRVAQCLSGARPEVYVAGGRVRPHEQAVGGESAVAQFGALWFDVSVIGASGITEEGLFDYSVEDAPLKRVYLTRAARCILLCDAAKFRHMSLVRIGDLSEISDLVTDAQPPQEITDALARAKVRLHIARPALAL